MSSNYIEKNKHIIDELTNYYNNVLYSPYNKTKYYRLNAIKNAIKICSEYKNIIKKGDDLKDIPGIGVGTIEKIDNILKNGKLTYITDNPVINSISLFNSIYGIGYTLAKTLVETHKIYTIKDLINAHKTHKITLTNNMLTYIKYIKFINNNIPNETIKHYEKELINKINNTKTTMKINSIICGSYRRNKSFSSDLDILIYPQKNYDDGDKNEDKNGDKNEDKNGDNVKIILGSILDTVVTELFDEYFIIERFTTLGKTHFQGLATFKYFGNKKYLKQNFDVSVSVIRLDIIIVNKNSLYPALIHFTGSSMFNQKLRLHAKNKNMKLNEFGLYILDKTKYVNIDIKSEEDLFKKLGLNYVEPENR